MDQLDELPADPWELDLKQWTHRNAFREIGVVLDPGNGVLHSMSHVLSLRAGIAVSLSEVHTLCKVCQKTPWLRLHLACKNIFKKCVCLFILILGCSMALSWSPSS